MEAGVLRRAEADVSLVSQSVSSSGGDGQEVLRLRPVGLTEEDVMEATCSEEEEPCLWRWNPPHGDHGMHIKGSFEFV